MLLKNNNLKNNLKKIVSSLHADIHLFKNLSMAIFFKSRRAALFYILHQVLQGRQLFFFNTSKILKVPHRVEHETIPQNFSFSATLKSTGLSKHIIKPRFSSQSFKYWEAVKVHRSRHKFPKILIFLCELEFDLQQQIMSVVFCYVTGSSHSLLMC